MPATPEAAARTRSFARVLGPFLVLVPGAVVFRAADLGAILPAFFGNEALVWITAAILILFGLVVVAFHQHWSSAAGIVISLFGWVLVIRGVVLLVAPQLIASGADAALTAEPLVQIAFGLLAAAGLWLTYVGWRPLKA